MHVIRTAALIAALLVVVTRAGAAAAAEIENLYQAQTIVTGSDERNRGSGMAACLAEVLVKASGDPRLLADPAVAALADDAPRFVESFRYHDRMAGIPYHDEQGSRDRPFDLIVDFAPARIDDLLRSLGREPWPALRPRVVVFLAMRHGTRRILVTADGPRDLERESLAAAASRRGVPVTLPNQAVLAAAGLSFDSMADVGLARLDELAGQVGGDLALAGTMSWDEAAIAWIAEWRLRTRGKVWRWQASSETFDEAFRQAMGGAAQVLSGNGQPE
jgi:hypothetical protein